MEWLVDDHLVPGAGPSVARMTLKAGKNSPPHRHPNCDEFIYLAKGTIEQFKEADRVSLSPGQYFFIPAGETHFSVNRGDRDAILLLSYSAGIRHYESMEKGSGT